MKTSLFQGSRLREAREARGLTQSALSELSSIPGARLSHYENERHFPDELTIAALCRTLNIPAHFFYKQSRGEIEDRKVFWRSKMSAKMIERHRIQRRFDWFLDVQTFLDSQVSLPQVSIPVIKRYDDVDAIDADYIEKTADDLREHWSLGRGPISNLISVIESNGFIASVQRMNDEYLDAFSEWQDDLCRPVLFLGEEKMSYARRLFTTAHEIGHMLLHRDIDSSSIYNKSKLAKIEKQADYFASCFLLPADTFAADVYSASLDSLRSLKHHWQVAISAMIMRLRQLEIIDNEGKRRAFIQMSRRGWRKSEPGDDVIVHDLPRLTKSAFTILKESGRFTPETLERHIGLSTTDIESVSGLPGGFLRNEPENPYRLRLVN